MAQAFYTGLPVKLVRAGETIDMNIAGKKTKKRLPVDFLDEHNIESRINPMTINL